MEKVLARKKDNKGFSLVELIVVILIMAIIAVALAPQVMKWVGKSGENTDVNNAATIKSSVQTAVADYISQGNSASSCAGSYYVIPGKGIATEFSPATFAAPAADSLAGLIQDTMGEFPEVKSDKDMRFKIKITATGTNNLNTSVEVRPVNKDNKDKDNQDF